jgi:acetyl esterase
MKTKFILTMAAGIILMAACKSKTSTSGTDSTSTTTTDTVMKKDTAAKTMADIKPSGPAPAWASDMKPQMQAVVEKLESYGDKSIPTLSAVDARKNHTPTDAVMDLMKQYNIPMPVFNIYTMEKDIPVGGGTIHLSIYTPKTGNGTFPVIVYYHGGGFVIANIEVYSASAKTCSLN